MSARAGAVLVLLAVAAAAAAAVATIDLRPGQWRLTSEVWIDGKPVLRSIDAAGAQATAEVLRNARAQMTPAERAEFDRNLPARDSVRDDTECITAAEAAMDPEAALQTALQAVHQPPWICSFSQRVASPSGTSFNYNCRTPAGARADGKARFEASETRYVNEITGRSHVVDMQTGKPLDARILPVRALNEGRWLAERCTP